MRVTISVIMPVFNGAAYIAEALASVLRAWPREHLEVLVVDDGSTDDSGAVAASVDPIVTVLRQENRGRSAARNAGIQAASGTYIAFLDADDRYAADKLTRQAQYLEAHPSAVGVLTSLERFGASSPPLRDGWSDDAVRALAPADFVVVDVGHPASLVARRDVVQKVRFPEGMTICEDRVFLGALRTFGPIGYIPEPLYQYRVHGHERAGQQAYWRRFESLMAWHAEEGASSGIAEPGRLESRIWLMLAAEIEGTYFARRLDEFKRERERLRQVFPRELSHPMFARTVWPRPVYWVKDAVDAWRSSRARRS